MADEVTLPTIEEIAALPRWAKVAFAARCARRILPLFKVDDSNRAGDALRLRQAVEACERYAADLSPSEQVLEDALFIDHGFADTSYDDSDCHPTNAVQAAVAFAADHREIRSKRWAGRAMAYAVRALGAESATVIGKDFLAVRSYVSGTDQPHDTPVPPWVFGPMWPNGVPEGWPEEDPQERLQVTVGVPEDAQPKQTADYLNRLHELLNRLNIQNGGAGIAIDTVRREQPKEAPVPVGGGS